MKMTIGITEINRLIHLSTFKMTVYKESRTSVISMHQDDLVWFGFGETHRWVFGWFFFSFFL